MLIVLDHLALVGFDSAPKVLGRDAQGRYVLTYIHGDVALPPQPAWSVTDHLLASVAILLRRYHDAVRSLKTPDGISWPTAAPEQFRGSVVGHMDVSMANVVCRDGRAIALIDFEEVGPVAPLWDVIRTVRHWVPLLDPADLQGELAAVDGRQPERLALFAEAYGLGRTDRAALVDGALMSADLTYQRMYHGARTGHAGYLREWEGPAAIRNRRGQAWVAANRTRLQAALDVPATSTSPKTAYREKS